MRKLLEENGHRFRTQSDGEVICHLYDEFGEDAFSHLEGAFAISLWDKNNKKLYLVRDRIGIKPLFYSINNKIKRFDIVF